MKKYSNVEIKILFIQNMDVITGSSEFFEDVNDNDVGNDGFTAFSFSFGS